MSTSVFKAIVDRWDSESLDSTFSGGLFNTKAPLEAAFPYVVFYPISSAPATWTSNREIRLEVIQFSIYYEEENSADPVKKIGELMDTLKAAYEFAPLSIAAADGRIIEVRRQGEFFEEEDEEIWHGQITYNIRREAPVNYLPS